MFQSPISLINFLLESDVDKKLESEKSEEDSDISSLFGSRQLQKSTCLKCSTEVRWN